VSILHNGNTHAFFLFTAANVPAANAPGAGDGPDGDGESEKKRLNMVQWEVA